MKTKLFETIYDTYFNQIWRYISWRVGNKHECEDIVSEIFIRVFDNFHKLRSEQPEVVRGWIFSIARNTLNAFYKNPRHSVSLEEIGDIEAEDISMSDEVEIKLIFAHFFELITQLPSRQADAIVLRYINELSNKEIAQVMNIDEKSVASNISRGLKTIYTTYMMENKKLI